MPVPLMLIAQDPLIAAARALLAAERHCAPSLDSVDITVCGMRNADRFRVPFMGYEEGDPRAKTVMAERVRLLRRTTSVEDMSPFLVEGGVAGLSAGTRGVHRYRTRRPAP